MALTMPERTPSGSEILAQGVLLERLALYDRALERYRLAAASPDPAVRAEALRRESDVFRARCQWQDALDRARESVYIAESAGLTHHFTEALTAQGMVLLILGELEPAGELFARIIALTRADSIRGLALLNLGVVRATEGRVSEADAFFEDSHEYFQRARHSRGIAATSTNRGRVALDLGDLDRARTHFESALESAQRAEDLELIAMAKLNLAECYALSDDYRRAEDLASNALGCFTVAGNHWRRVECLRLFGDMRLRQRDARTAERAYRLGLDLARRIGARVEERVLAGRLESLVGTAH